MEVEQMMRFGGNTVTLVHPLVLMFTLVAAVLTFNLPRKYVPIPLIIGLVMIPAAQRVVVFGISMTIYRILLLCVWSRFLAKGEHRVIVLNRTDRIVLWWMAAATVAYTILWTSVGALVNRLGIACDVLGMYFLLRAAVDDERDVQRIIKTLLGLAVLVGLLMVVENRINRNPFAELGGVPSIPETREGRVRAQGPFNHAILAGTFGATLIPLAMALWWRARRGLASAGIAGALAMTWASGSSGPLLSLVAGFVALMMWPLRDSMMWVRRGTVVVLFALHIVMKDPVWALVGRADIVAGSTGWHRYFLIDNFIRRFDEWFLVGTRYTHVWGYGLVDQTNEYVAIGTSGGLLTLVLFFVLIKRLFAGLREARVSAGNRSQELALWAVGSALFAHLVSFVGVSYFGQMAIVWYLFLGLTAAINSIARKRVAAPGHSPARGLTGHRFSVGLSPNA